jgi:hypothetical protein
MKKLKQDIHLFKMLHNSLKMGYNFKDNAGDTCKFEIALAI